MHTSDSIYSISATKNVSHQSHLLRLRQYLMAQSGYSANPLKKSRFSKCVNLIALIKASILELSEWLRRHGHLYLRDPAIAQLE